MNRDKIKQILMPTRVEILLSILISLSVILFNVRSQLSSLLTKGALAPQEADGLISSYFTIFLNNVSEQRFANKLTLVLFWAAIGFLVYMLFLAVVNAGIFLYDQYILKTAYTNQEGQVRGIFLKRHLLKISIVTVGLVHTSLIMQLYYPITTTLVGNALVAPISWLAIIWAISSFVALVITVYGLYILSRLAFTNIYE